jgi:hypothetical protein
MSAMFSADYFRKKFDHALPYARYVVTGTPEQQRRWQQVYDLAAPTPAQQQLLEGFTREMNLLIVSGVWCGDCVQQVPLIARLAEANSARLHLRILDRDQHRDLIEPLRINGGDRVPVLLLLAEDFEFCALAGDRTLSRYRAIAHRQLGASCPTGLLVPDSQELSATMQDWLNEIERVQLMLRVSPRLRKKHGD